MSRILHTVAIKKGSQLAQLDRIILGLLPNFAHAAGDGAVASIGAGSPGAGYTAIPTVAFTNKASGSSATATAVMKVVSASVTAGGTGGTPGAVTITGTTGTGTKFQATGVINGSGVLTGPLVVTVGGAYTALPSPLTAEPVTGGNLSGATIAISLGVASYSIGAGGTLYPNGTTAVLSGGTPITAAVSGAVAITTANGNSVTIPVQMSGLPVDANGVGTYGVQITPSQDAVANVSAKTADGFTVTLNPRLAANQIAAGTIDIQLAA